MIRLDQDLFNFNFIYFNNFQVNNNRKSLTMKNFLKLVSVYVGAFFFSSARMCGLYLIVIQICLYLYTEYGTSYQNTYFRYLFPFYLTQGCFLYQWTDFNANIYRSVRPIMTPPINTKKISLKVSRYILSLVSNLYYETRCYTSDIICYDLHNNHHIGGIMIRVLECGRSWVRAPVRSIQRLYNWYWLFLR